MAFVNTSCITHVGIKKCAQKYTLRTGECAPKIVVRLNQTQTVKMCMRIEFVNTTKKIDVTTMRAVGSSMELVKRKIYHP